MVTVSGSESLGDCGGSGFNFLEIDCLRRRVEAADLQVLSEETHRSCRSYGGTWGDSSRGLTKHNVRATTRKRGLEMETK